MKSRRTLQKVGHIDDRRPSVAPLTDGDIKRRMLFCLKKIFNIINNRL